MDKKQQVFLEQNFSIFSKNPNSAPFDCFGSSHFPARKVTQFFYRYVLQSQKAIDWDFDVGSKDVLI